MLLYVALDICFFPSLGCFADGLKVMMVLMKLCIIFGFVML